MRVFLLAGGGLNEFAQAALEPFLAPSGRHTICGCAIDARPGKSLSQRLRENLRKGRGGYVLVMAATLPFRRRDGGVPTPSFCERHGIPVFETDSPYSKETVEAIRQHSPDVLVLLGGYGIVKEPLIGLAPQGVLSYHHGDMRRYRGQPPALWELYNGEQVMGVTVQRITAALDAGEPIVERSVEIAPQDTVGSLRARAIAISVDMLYEAVERLEDPAFAPARIDAFGPVYTLPTLRQWLLLNVRIARRRLSARGRRA